MSAPRTRFAVDVLQALTGDKVFARGEAYYRNGHVEILAVEGIHILAQVAGAEDYRTELIAGSKAIGGECSCPAFEDWGFCKHMVATALAANALTDDAAAEVTGARARIREHLRQLGIDDLANMVLALAERDADLFRELSMAAAGRCNSAHQSD